MQKIYTSDVIERHTLSVFVENVAGVLARVVGLFSGRGYNIESLTVAEVDDTEHMSRITIVTDGTPRVIAQIKAQLGRLVSVNKVVDLTTEADVIEREMVLIKVGSTGEERLESLRIAEIFHAHVIDTTSASFVFQLSAGPGKIDAFIHLMRPLGLMGIARTGVVAIARGANIV